MEKLIATVCGNEVLIFGGTKKLGHFVEATKGAALSVANAFDAMSPKAQRLSMGLPETWEHYKPMTLGARLADIASRRLGQNAEYNRKNKLHYTGRRPECAPNRKAGARLVRRQADWTAMMARGDFRGSEAGYHKPGSMSA